jgi:hypothetical protein
MVKTPKSAIWITMHHGKLEYEYYIEEEPEEKYGRINNLCVL